MLNNKFGCLMWAILFCFVALWGWKLLDFFVLQPAGVTKGINETCDMVNRIQNTSAKQVEFLSLWADYKRSTDVEFDSSAFQGDSFVVVWHDTLHVPVFPSIPHVFRLSRLVR